MFQSSKHHSAPIFSQYIMLTMSIFGPLKSNLTPFMQNLLRICLCLCLTQVLDAQNFNNGFSFYLPEFDSSAQTFLPSFPAYTITSAHR